MKWVAIVPALFCAGSVFSQVCNLPLEESAPDLRFQLDPADSGVVTDLRTGLSWQRCRVGREIVDAGTLELSDDQCQPMDQNPADGVADNDDTDTTNDVAEAYNWNDALVFAEGVGNSWRLPNIKELASLVELACSAPAINFNVFPNAGQNPHWSSTPFSATDASVWAVSFLGGTDEILPKNTGAFVYLVRD